MYIRREENIYAGRKHLFDFNVNNGLFKERVKEDGWFKEDIQLIQREKIQDL